jgi:hypothetical protein
MSLTDSLDALLAEHDRIGSPLRDQLIGGPPRSRVEEVVRGVGLEPPADLIDFFSWRAVGDDRGGTARVDWFWPAAPHRLDPDPSGA